MAHIGIFSAGQGLRRYNQIGCVVFEPIDSIEHRRRWRSTVDR